MFLWNPFLNFQVHPDDLTPGCDLCPDVPDGLTAIAQYCARQAVLRDVFLGKLHPDDYLDCLIEQGLSADSYLSSIDGVLTDLDL
ncbi:hypothetical protein HPC62_00010 [Thermoleptolyngbya sichuanensis A183]|uniref:Uncharacterized protein n=1 Tax=Thermoleptolyngbya sichuanensis A183 TaxID=2737172 RepID=A0A6M8BB58_9CYAN|nr:hypothetical protein [Thermoleptolyngbya sichuanensis]QKD80771.1 hypothetical protein HPC62_00010 [Thermoleptolyngbya sichuanensis A183]